MDLHKFGQTVFHTRVEGVVEALNIVQDKVHGTCYLLVRNLRYDVLFSVSLGFRTSVITTGSITDYP